jgi:hypothetical protein
MMANATNVAGRVSGPVTTHYFLGGGHLYFLGAEWGVLVDRALAFLDSVGLASP